MGTTFNIHDHQVSWNADGVPCDTMYHRVCCISCWPWTLSFYQFPMSWQLFLLLGLSNFGKIGFQPPACMTSFQCLCEPTWEYSYHHHHHRLLRQICGFRLLVIHITKQSLNYA